MKTEIISGRKGLDEALRDLDRREEELDRQGEVVHEHLVEDHSEIGGFRALEQSEFEALLEDARMSAIMSRLLYACRFNMPEPPRRYIWASSRDAIRVVEADGSVRWSLVKTELRSGNPPSDSDRPEHLRGLDLVVDPARHGPISPATMRAYHHAKQGGGLSSIERAKEALGDELKGIA